MNQPTIHEALLDMLLSGAINVDDAQRYYDNYVYFENHKSQIETKYAGKWVASLNSQIFAADTEEQLDQLINSEPLANRAYSARVAKDGRCQTA